MDEPYSQLAAAAAAAISHIQNKTQLLKIITHQKGQYLDRYLCNAYHNILAIQGTALQRERPDNFEHLF